MVEILVTAAVPMLSGLRARALPEPEVGPAGNQHRNRYHDADCA
jgi:hypothetical protein